MSPKQAWIIADHMVGVNREIFQPKMTTKGYVKQRADIIKSLLEAEE